MRATDVAGGIALGLLSVALLTGSVPTALAGGALLVASAGATRPDTRHHARDAACDTEGPRP